MIARFMFFYKLGVTAWELESSRACSGFQSRRKSGIALVSFFFDFINISYLLYFSESALLSVFFYLLESECLARAQKLYPLV